jgi:hypothetical protein
MIAGRIVVRILQNDRELSMRAMAAYWKCTLGITGFVRGS